MKDYAGYIGGIILAVILFIGLGLLALCTTKVDPGYVAVQYSMNGGLKDEVLTQGWHLVSPTVKTKEYTIGLEQSYLTKGKKGDSTTDESFEGSSSEGKAVTIDLTFTYQFNEEKIAEVFTRFKGKSGEEVRDTFIKPNIISWTKEVVAKHQVADILGAERANINVELTDYLSKKFEPYHIKISNVSLINIDVDKDTKKAINEKIKAQQAAEKQAIENQMNIDKATADATAKRTAAQADADALLIKAKAEADANEMINKSLSEKVLNQNWIEKWNGTLPTYMSGKDNNVMLDLSDK